LNSMKKWLFALSALLFTLSSAVSVARAAPAPITARGAGPYQGTFSGYVYGDRGSRAPISLDLTHVGDKVSGEVTLGEGLYVDGGRCGGAYIPAGEQAASGETLRADPNRLQAAVDLKVSGLQISATLDSQISADGESLTAQAVIDLPWLCGGDPVLEAELSKIQ
jgi:hypothetical protein